MLYTVPCERETVCATGDDEDRTLVSWSIDTTDPAYINNWIEQLNGYCTPSLYIGLSGALAFAGIAVSCFFVPKFGDKYGRKIVWMISCALNIPLLLGANLTDHLGMINFLIYYLGMAHIGRYICAFILLTEATPKRHQALVGTALMTSDVLATLYISIFLRFISNDANKLVWLAFSLCIVASLLSLLTLESPSWLV